MSDIFAEVDEVMRQEKLAKFWHDNAPYIIAFVVLTIAMTGGISMYRSWDQSQKHQQTALYMEYLESKDFDAALSDNALKGNLRAMLYLQAAEAKLVDGDTDAALKLYQDVIETTKAKGHIKDLAKLMIVRLDTEQQELLGEIKSPSPYYAQSLLETALIEFNANEDAVAAVETLKTLRDLDELSPALTAQTNDLLRLYQAKANEQTQGAE